MKEDHSYKLLLGPAVNVSIYPGLLILNTHMNKWAEQLLLILMSMVLALFLTMGITVGLIITWMKDYQ